MCYEVSERSGRREFVNPVYRDRKMWVQRYGGGVTERQKSSRLNVRSGSTISLGAPRLYVLLSPTVDGSGFKISPSIPNCQ